MTTNPTGIFLGEIAGETSSFLVGEGSSLGGVSVFVTAFGGACATEGRGWRAAFGGRRLDSRR